MNLYVERKNPLPIAKLIKLVLQISKFILSISIMFGKKKKDNSIRIRKYFEENSKKLNEMCIRNKGHLNNMNNLAMCRICYQSDGTLIKPCSCKGSIAFIHNECLEKWIEVRNDSLCCELCTSNFKINFNLYFKMKLRKWFDGESFFIVLFFIAFAFMFFSFCIIIFHILLTSTILTTTTNKDVTVITSILFIDKFLIFLANIFALIIFIYFMLFVVSIFAFCAISICIRIAIMDHL